MQYHFVGLDKLEGANSDSAAQSVQFNVNESYHVTDPATTEPSHVTHSTTPVQSSASEASGDPSEVDDATIAAGNIVISIDWVVLMPVC